MRRFCLTVSLFLCVWGGLSFHSIARAEIGPYLRGFLSSQSNPEQVLVWVFFADKGGHEIRKTSIPMDLVSPRALARRALVLPPSDLLITRISLSKRGIFKKSRR